MTITTEREKQIDFSDPYFNADQALLVESDSKIKSVDDLSEATVGVQAGSTGQLKGEDLHDGGQVGEIKPYRTIGEAFADLRAGKVEGVIYALSAAHKKVSENDGEIRYVEPIPTGDQYGIAFPKDSLLVEPVNRGAGGDQSGRHLRGALREVDRDAPRGDTVESCALSTLQLASACQPALRALSARSGLAAACQHFSFAVPAAGRARRTATAAVGSSLRSPETTC